MSEFDTRTVLAAIAFMRGHMEKQIAWASLPIIGSPGARAEAFLCLYELESAERAVRAEL